MSIESDLEVSPITVIQETLDKLFPGEHWWEYENETIALELDFKLTTLLSDKLWVLKLCISNPAVCQEDPAFVIYSAETLNNNLASFDRIPHVTSLELAFAIDQLTKVLVKAGKFTGFADGVQKAIAYVLNEEGYSEPVSVFNFIPKELLTPGQTEEDTNNKRLAVDEYIKHMESL